MHAYAAPTVRRVALPPCPDAPARLGPCLGPAALPRAPRPLAALLLLALTLTGCAGGSGRQYREHAADLAAASGLAPVFLPAGPWRLAGFARNGPGEVLTVYIEGDGRAFVDRRTPSADPTPAEPLGLLLARRDPAVKLLVLARPGQYLPAEELAGYDPALWTQARYSPQVVAALGQALDAAKDRFGANRLRLRGYSGGGALAVLVAAERTDVDDIVTVAANLDTEAWTSLHGVSPLRLSRNPVDAAPALAGLPQTHYVGALDTVTPPALCRRYLARLPADAPARCLVIEGAGHHEGLVKAWEGIVGQAGLSP